MSGTPGAIAVAAISTAQAVAVREVAAQAASVGAADSAYFALLTSVSTSAAASYAVNGLFHSCFEVCVSNSSCSVTKCLMVV